MFFLSTTPPYLAEKGGQVCQIEITLKSQLTGILLYLDPWKLQLPNRRLSNEEFRVSYPMNRSAAPSSLASMSVAPSPTMMTESSEKAFCISEQGQEVKWMEGLGYLRRPSSVRFPRMKLRKIWARTKK